VYPKGGGNKYGDGVFDPADNRSRGQRAQTVINKKKRNEGEQGRETAHFGRADDDKTDPDGGAHSTYTNE